MPRAGANLLQALLDQNPQFHAWVTSGLPEVLIGVRNIWDKFIEHQAADYNTVTAKKKNVLATIIQGYYNEVTEDYVFDNNRAWLSHIEMLEWVLGRKVKVLVPVRDLREILTSMELLWRNSAKELQVPDEVNNYLQMQTVAGRCQYWMGNDKIVGLTYNRIADAIHRGYRDRLHFVPYEDLCNRPNQTLDAIYEFLNIKPFEHNYDNIVTKYNEKDQLYGYVNLHMVKPKLQPVMAKADGVLGVDVAKTYTGNYIWK